MTKYIDDQGLQYFRKRTEVLSTGGTITISEKNSKRFSNVKTKNDIDVNLDNIVDNNTILKDNNKLKSGLTLAKITLGLPTKVKEQYALKDSQGNVIGSTINIYYDSSLSEVYLGNTDDTLINSPDASTGKKYTIVHTTTGNDALCFVYILDTGLYTLAKVDLGDFLKETEFKDGLLVDNHQVSAKISDGLEFGDARSGDNRPIKMKISDGLEFGDARSGDNRPIKIKLHNKYVGPSTALRDGISVLEVDENGLNLDLKNLLLRSFKSSSYITLTLTQAGATPKEEDQVLLPILQPEAKIVTIDSATSQNDGLATANDVKLYIEGNTYWKSDGTYQTSGIYTESNTASGTYSVAEGNSTTASGNLSHTEGSGTIASGGSSHAEGEATTASGTAAHAEGYISMASGNYSHAEGWNARVYGNNAHAEGQSTVVNGRAAHAEGNTTYATGEFSHAEGHSTKANAEASHAEGGGSIIKSTFTISGSAGTKGYVSSQDHGLVVGSVIKYNNCYATVVEVTNSTHFTLDHTLDSDAALINAHVDIITGISYGNYSHVENRENIAIGASSHAEGLRTIANNDNEHACGKYNLSTPNQTLFSIGNGTSDSDRRNVFEVTQDGNVIGGSFSSGTSIQTIDTADTAPVVTKSESIILLEQDASIPPLLDLASFSMSPGQHVTIFLTSTFNSLSVSLVFGYDAYIYTLGNVDHRTGPLSLLDPSEVYNITALYSKIDIIRLSTHQWTITLY